MAEPLNGHRKNPWVLLLIGVLFLLGAVGFVLYHNRWVRSAFQGPVPITLTALQELKDPSSLSNPWVELTFNEAIHTGVVMERKKGGDRTPRSKYFLVRVGDRWLIADVPADFTGNRVVGYLDKWWSPLSKKVIDQIKDRFPDRDILPYQLNAEYDYKGQCFSMLGVAAFFFLGGLVCIGFARAQMREVNRPVPVPPRPGQPLPAEHPPETWTP